MHEMARKGAIEVVHVGDEHNPSDYLTKWLKKEKVEKSVRYSSGDARTRPSLERHGQEQSSTQQVHSESKPLRGRQCHAGGCVNPRVG